MKLLALHLFGHDTNVTYYDGTDVRYINLERPKGVKKFHYNDNDLGSLTEDTHMLGIDWSNLDAVAFTNHEHNSDDIEAKTDWQFRDGEQVREVTEELFHDIYPFTDIKAKKYFRVKHHYAHKRSADWLFGDCHKGLVIDGHGDYKEHISIFEGTTKSIEKCFNDMFSIGRLYALTTLQILKNPPGGPNSVRDNVGKIMGLMSWGEYNKEYAKYLSKFPFEEVTAHMTNRLLFQQFQFRKKTTVIEQATQDGLGYSPTHDDIDWLHTWQEVLFQYMLDFCREHFHPNEKFSFSGGVAHNVCFNELLNREFPNAVIPPCVGDEGLSLGSMYELMQRYDITADFPKGQAQTWSYEEPTQETIKAIANYIAMGKVVTNFQGLSEIGPRALGRRSIFMRPDINNVPKYLNQRHIKQREWWRPYGVMILEEDLNSYLYTYHPSPYMLHTAAVKNKEALSGVIHADDSVRYQTVNENDGWLYEMMIEYKKQTNLSAIVNTSLNIPDKPIMYDKAQMKYYMQTVPGDVFFMHNECFIGDNAIKHEGKGIM